MAASAHISEFDVRLVGDFAEEGSLLDAKGLGELTATVVAPATATAADRATGARLRGLRITTEKPIEVSGVVERVTRSTAPRAGRTGLWA